MFYIQMFVHVCRTGQPDIRTISVSHWGSELGLAVLAGLSRLYTSLVWESTVLMRGDTADRLSGEQEGKTFNDFYNFSEIAFFMEIEKFSC